MKLERSRLKVFADWLKENHEAVEGIKTKCIW